MPDHRSTSTAGQLSAVADSSIVRDIAEQFQKFHGAEIKTIDGPGGDAPAVIAILPDGKKIMDLKPFLDAVASAPKAHTGTAQLQDLGSFIEHVNLFALDDSVIFAHRSRTAPSLTAVLDYREKKTPRFGRHRSVYACPLSDEWKAWTANDGKAMSQGDFAAFLEDRILDVILADETDDLRRFAELAEGRWTGPAGLMSLARNLAVNVETQVRQAVTLSTGEIAVSYVEQHKDGAGEPVKIPNLFMIAVPVFYADTAYRIPARLRYRVQGGRITWSYSLYRVDRVLDDAFNGICERAKDETDLPVLLGAPES